MPTETKSLKRSVGAFEALLITLSAVTPAVSVFAIAPGVIQQAGTGAFLSFLAAGVICVFMAFVYAELSSAYPLTGGEYAIVGRVLGPMWGFMVMGIFLFGGGVFATAFMSVGTADYLQPMFPSASARTLGMVNVVVTSLLALLNIRVNSLITGCFLAVELLLLALVAILGFGHLSHPLSGLILNPVHLDNAGHLQPVPAGPIALATASAIFAYNGYGQAVYLGEETKNAARRIAHVILWALAITLLAEIIPVTAVLAGAPDLASLLGAKEGMMAAFVASIGGEQMKNLVSVGIALAILNANIAVMIMAARLFYSTGRDQVWPGPLNRALTRIHLRFDSPWVATLIFGALATAACLLPHRFLLILIGTSLVAVYMALCLAAIVGRRTGSTAHSQYRMPWYPLPPLAGLAALLFVLYANYLDEEVGRPSLVAVVIMLVVAAVYYLLVLRRRGPWVLRGHEDEAPPALPERT
jgi:amino acid transporter